MGAERTAPGRVALQWVNVTFYGVRGSCPCSGDRYRRYGGNTSCLVIDIEGDEPLIVDLGTGLRAYGDVLHREVRALGTPMHATALLTHLHFDHILGIPFFGPLHDPGARLTVYGPAQPKGTLKDALHAAVQPPVFPIHMEQFRGELITIDVGSEDFSIGVGQGDGPARPALGRHARASGSRRRDAPSPTCRTTRPRWTGGPSPRPSWSSARTWTC